MSWVIVTTRAAAEEVAETRMRQAGYRCYLPRRKTQQGNSVPLWPRYFFVEGWRGWPAHTIPGEPRLLKIGGHAARMWDRDVEIIRQREQAGEFDDPQPAVRGKRTDIKAGDSVEFDWSGGRAQAILVRLTDSGQAVVSMMIFGRVTRATIPQDALRKVAP